MWGVNAAAQLRLPLRAEPALGRADWLTAPSNAEASRRIEAWRAWPGGALALFGGAGVGKSHLGAVWAAEAHAAVLSPGAVPPSTGRPVWIDMADAWPDAPLLFTLLNRAARGEGALLLAGRGAPALWPVALPDLRSRLNALPAVEVGEPDEALLEALLVRFFRERQVRPSPELLRYLVRRMDRSAAGARELVARLDAAAVDGRLNLALARQVLADETVFADETGGLSCDGRVEDVTGLGDT